MSFQALILALIPNPFKNPKEKMIEGCQIFFPDTIFFDRGKIDFIALMDKDFCLSMNKSTEYKKLAPLDTRKQLEVIVAQRKERSEKYWLQEECNKRKKTKNKAASTNIRNNDYNRTSTILSTATSDKNYRARLSLSDK